MSSHRTTGELQDLFAQGFLDTRSKPSRRNPNENEPAYKVGVSVARTYLKMSEADAFRMFKSCLNATLDLPKDEPEHEQNQVTP